MLTLVVHWGDVARWLVMVAPLLVGAVVIRLVQRRRMTRPSGRPPRSRHYSLRKLAPAVETVLVVDAAALLGAIVLPRLVAASTSGFLVAMVIFVIWFYRARVNAEGHDWPQRRPPGWAIFAWLIPLANFWIPFEIMADIWRAGQPEQARANRAMLPGIWWTCLLAFFCMLSLSPTGTAASDLYVSVPIYGTGALAVAMTAVLVQKVSSGPLGESAPGLDAPYHA